VGHVTSVVCNLQLPQNIPLQLLYRCTLPAHYLSTVGLNVRAVTSQFLMGHELDISHLCVYACRKIRSGIERFKDQDT